jgi:hypothetical protein
VGFFDDRPRRPIVETSGPGTVSVDSIPTRRVLPGLVTTRVIVFRTEVAVLVLDRFEVYRDIVMLRCNLRLRDYARLPIDGIPLRDSFEWWAGEDPPDEFLRLAIVFSDGSAWSNIDFVRVDAPPAPGPRFHFGSGGGGGGSWTMDAWIEPIPPEGPLTFVAEWPSCGIPETRAMMEASELRQAARLVEEFWPR